MASVVEIKERIKRGIRHDPCLSVAQRV